MPDYQVSFKASAEKELLQLPNSAVARIFPEIEQLALDPRPQGCKKLRGGGNLWRIRIGDYRAIYLIDDGRRQVEIMRVAHRGDVYER